MYRKRQIQTDSALYGHNTVQTGTLCAHPFPTVSIAASLSLCSINLGGVPWDPIFLTGPLKREPDAQPSVYRGDLETICEKEPVNVTGPGDQSNLCWCRAVPFLLAVNWTGRSSTGC